MSSLRFTRRTGLLLALLIVLGSFFAYQYHQRRVVALRQAVTHQARLRALDPATATDVTTFRKRLDLSAHGLAASNIGPGDGVWQQTERARAAAAVDGLKYDYVALPLEQNYRFYDRTTRLMVARRLAAALAAATGKRVMSPELALRVLGPRASRLPYPQVAALAHRVGARVVHVFLALHPMGGGKARARTGTLYVVLTGANGHIVKMFRTRFRDNGAAPWDMGFGKVAVQAVATLTGKRVSQVVPDKVAGSVPPLPVHLSDMPTVAEGPLANAAYLQLLAMLTPQRMSYERHRLFERSLMALDGVDHASPFYKLLTARALLHLYRRPAALKYLASPSTAAEKALREYADGNYPELAALVPKVKAPLLRAMAALELSDLGYAYGKTPRSSYASLSVPSQQWLTLLVSAEHDDDVWYAPHNLSFFARLQGLFPAFDSAFRSTVMQGATSGTLNPDGLNFGLLKSIFDQAFAAGGKAGRDDYGPRLEMADIWSFYRNIAVANLLRRLDRDVNVYVRYGAAKNLAAEEAPWLGGNPCYLTLYTQALYHYAKQVQGDQRRYARKTAAKLGVRAIAYDGENDYDTYLDRWYVERLRQSLPAQPWRPEPLAVCAYERCDYPASIEVDAQKGEASALPYEFANFGLFREAAKAGKLSTKQIDAILAHRFDGAPRKIPFIADRQLKAGHEAQAIATLKKAVAAGSTSWAVYRRLGDLKLERGDYSGASHVYLKYPVFAESHPDNPVQLSNEAYAAGYDLFWHGHYKEAAPLFRIASDLSTGAQSEMASDKYLAMSRGDYRTAIGAAYDEARRYNSAAGYRDYLVILQLVGKHAEADAGFKAVAPLFDSTKVWEAVFVGQRMEKRSFARMAGWVRRYLASGPGSDQNFLASIYLAAQAAVDRTPSQAAVRTLAKIEKAHPQRRYDASLDARLKKIESGAVKRDPAPGKVPGGYASRRNTAFLYAYTLLQQGRYAQSADAFLQFDDNFPLLSVGRATYQLPYFAMAAAGAGRKETLSALSKLLPSGSAAHFYDKLTRAVIAADQGHTKASLSALLSAYRKLPVDQGHPVGSWYELVQTAEWLHRRSGDPRFLERALDWARQYQRIKPQEAWAYAFDARYSKDGAERARAAAFALYLDPASRWLRKVPPAVLKEARAWWPSHDPFTLKRKRTAAPSMAS